MEREIVRESWKELGILASSLSNTQLQRLRSLINLEMIKSGLICNTFRCHQRFVKFGKPPRFCASLRCKSRSFEAREVVTFNEDGFVGFAGWADQNNVQPILIGFSIWVDEIKVAQAA